VIPKDHPSCLDTLADIQAVQTIQRDSLSFIMLRGYPLTHQGLVGNQSSGFAAPP